MAKKKKKKKQKIKPSFMNVLNRGKGGELKEIKVSITQAMQTFGKPLMDFLTKPVDDDEEKFLYMTNEAMLLISTLWNSAITENPSEAAKVINESEMHNGLFDADKLIPAMFKRFNTMFPRFHEPEFKREVMMTTGDHSLNINEYLSEAFQSKIGEETEQEDNLLNDEIFEDDLIDYEKELEIAPNDSELRMEYAADLYFMDDYKKAIEQFEIGAKCATKQGDTTLAHDYAEDILCCLHKAGRKLDDFPWHTTPEIMSNTEYISKLLAYVEEHGGQAAFATAISTVIGNKCLDPATTPVQSIHESLEIEITESEDGDLLLVLI